MTGKSFYLQEDNNSAIQISNNTNKTLVRKSVTKFLEKSMEGLSKEEEITRLQSNYLSLEGRLKFNNELLLKMEEENQHEKRNCKESIKLFKNFFCQLLMVGKDCRLRFNFHSQYFLILEMKELLGL